MMRIAVANLTAGGLSGGYRKYLARLMPLLAADRRVRALTVFVPAGAPATIDRDVDVRTWRLDTGAGTADLAAQVAALQPDVVFIPTARYARFGGLPVVTMVRNMEPLTVPFGGNTLAEGTRNVARAWDAWRSSRRATRVLAVSDFVRTFIIRRWRLDPDRVGVVYHGVDQLATGPDAAPAAPLTLFTAGSIRPARGLEDILQALPQVSPDVRLMIAGRPDRRCEGYVARLRVLCERLGIVKRVTWAGELDQTEMAAAFRHCATFVMTSRAEACPNIALEAMSHGCASVSVDRPPMPEFFADAAVYYASGDAQTLAAALRSTLDSPAALGRLRDAARQRARTFTWEKTRDRTIEELERACS